MWDATLRPHVRVPKKRGTRSEANEVQIEQSAPRDGRNPLDRPRSASEQTRSDVGRNAILLRRGSCGASRRFPLLPLDVAVFARWKWSPLEAATSLARNSLSRDGASRTKGKEVCEFRSFLGLGRRAREEEDVVSV